ncbi:MAG: carbamoyltransferase HypF, partial [Mycobacteriales bacterium]
MRTRSRIRVRGIVQGVGFRPFVKRTANALGLSGHVGNDADGVFIEAEGDPAALRALVEALRTRAPALAVVESLQETALPAIGELGFRIVATESGPSVSTWIAADAATCADCLRELGDQKDRRYRYPFINCTNCGPRFSIVCAIPYDRENTTMATFAMCALCAREYHDPGDRRFHAQPTCCPDCGPRLALIQDGHELPTDPISSTARLLAQGAIVAVKGLGGYHLAVTASDEGAVSRLRGRKHREDKPFALMCADLAQAEQLVAIDAVERALLTSRRRPIVLLARRRGADVAAAVAPGSRFLGVMLAYTPVHHLLAAAVGQPLVLTSGNVSDEPIAYADADAVERLAGVADAFLASDRPIRTRVDDSVTRVVGGRELLIRRSRGYAPEPLSVHRPARRPVLGCGAELKSTFCLLRGRSAVVSHHI